MSIKYKSTQKRDSFGQTKAITHLLQDNEITESSPKALKDAKTWELTRGPKAGPWTPTVIARATRSVGATLTSCPRRHIHYATGPLIGTWAAIRTNMVVSNCSIGLCTMCKKKKKKPKMVRKPNVSPHKQIIKDDDVKECISTE